MAYTVKNFAHGSLASVLVAGATQLTVSPGHSLPELGTFVLVIWDMETYPNPSDDPNTEIVEAQYSGVPNVFNIIRGREGTTDSEHAVGNEVALYFTAGVLNTLLNDDSAAAGITSGDISNWNTAYGWGDHAGLYDLVGEAASKIAGHELEYNHSLLHNPVTLGVANGLSMVGQELSLPTTASPTFVNLSLSTTDAASSPLFYCSSTTANYGFTIRSQRSIEMTLDSYRDSTSGSFFIMRHARGTAASPAILQDSDEVAIFFSRGYDGAGAWRNAAGLVFIVEGTPVSGKAPPTAIRFYTADGSGTSWSVRGGITHNGDFGIGTLFPNEKLEVNGKIRSNSAFNLNGTDGISTSFLDKDGNTITVVGGIITAKTAP